MKTLPEATAAIIAAARKVADAASDLENDEECEVGQEDWNPLRAALLVFADADIAYADARDLETKAQAATEKALQAADALSEAVDIFCDGPRPKDQTLIFDASIAYYEARSAQHQASADAHDGVSKPDQKAQTLGETLSARLAKVLGDAEHLAESVLDNRSFDVLVDAADALKDNVRAVYHSTPKADPTLEDRLLDRVSSWLGRVAPVVARGESDGATLTLRLALPQSDDDGTLVLDWTADEGLTGPAFDDARSGRVPGVQGP